MDSGNTRQATDNLRRELAQIGDTARRVSNQLTSLCNEVRPLEMALLRQALQKHRESLVLRDGTASAMRDKRKLGIGLGLAATAAILAGAMTNDSQCAVNAGLSGFRGMLLGLGESHWAVSLDAELRVVPRNQISPERNWVTLESLLQVLEKLESTGYLSSYDCFSSVADIIPTVRETPGLTYLALPTSA